MLGKRMDNETLHQKRDTVMTRFSRQFRYLMMVLVCATAFSCASLTGAGGPLVAPGAAVVKVADGYVFTEGPVCDSKGNVYFSDVRASKMYKWWLDGHVTMEREDTGGGNGLYFDPAGNLVVCEGQSQRITSVDPEGHVSVVIDKFEGKKLNSPNDLWIDAKGGIYITDPRYGRDMPEIELDGQYVFYIAPDRKSVRIVAKDLVKPNGTIGTEDGKTLYIADPGDKKTYVYNIRKDGSLGDRKLFAEQGSDGMTLDERGNLYLTGDTVSVYAPDGSKIRDIEIPEKPSNVTFGGRDRKTLFITARTSLYAIEMAVKGQ
jgi:gluconolactonase